MESTGVAQQQQQQQQQQQACTCNLRALSKTGCCYRAQVLQLTMMTHTVSELQKACVVQS